MSPEGIKIVAENRKARYDYHIEDKFEAGMVLRGTEVKSLRIGRCNLKDSYARIINDEIWAINIHIGPYPFAYYNNHEPRRQRKLLLHKAEIKKLYGKVNEMGYNLIPLRVYFKNGKAKIQIALARGKKKYDKRHSIRRRDEQRDLDRTMRRYK
jgi:SsrA-binding protein